MPPYDFIEPTALPYEPDLSLLPLSELRLWKLWLSNFDASLLCVLAASTSCRPGGPPDFFSSSQAF